MIQGVIFWCVIAGSVPVFWCLPKKMRSSFLALTSFAFLFYTDPKSVSMLAGWTALFYLVTKLAAGSNHAKKALGFLIILILGFLAFFKYAPPLAEKLLSDSRLAKLIIPLGASYYTFKLIHFAIEKSRGNLKNSSIQDFLCYMFLFPIFTAGPIERFDHFLDNQEIKCRLNSIVEGITRIAYGLIKKFVIVNMFIAPAMKPFLRKKCLYLSTDLHAVGTHEIWLFLILAFFEMYLSFAAYSDIAIGCSRLFGFKISENFNFPFAAKNLGDFWKRWHMTLVNWLQAYVYMPVIGLTRKPYIAIFVTFVSIGMWHAASLNWLLWSLFHAIGVSVHLTWQRKTRGRKRKPIEQRIWAITSSVFTFIFVATSLCFIASEHIDANLSLRLLAKCFFINI